MTLDTFKRLRPVFWLSKRLIRLTPKKMKTRMPVDCGAHIQRTSIKLAAVCTVIALSISTYTQEQTPEVPPPHQCGPRPASVVIAIAEGLIELDMPIAEALPSDRVAASGDLTVRHPHIMVTRWRDDSLCPV